MFPTAEKLSMTSREIAELVGSRHDSVKRTIETLSNKGVIELPQAVEIPTTTKPVAVYVFTGDKGKRDSIVVVAQLCPEFTARLVDRWQELEALAAAGSLPGTDPRIKNLGDMVRAGLIPVDEAKAMALEIAGIKQPRRQAKPRQQRMARWQIDGLPHKPTVRQIVEPDAVRPDQANYRPPRMVGFVKPSQVANVPMTAEGVGKKIIGGAHFVWLALWELDYMEWDGALTAKGKAAPFIIKQEGLADPYQFWQRDLLSAIIP